MTECNMLKHRIEESGITLTFLAKQLSIDRATLYNKLNGITEFKASEITIISRLLNLTTDERDEIFFFLSL